MHGIKQCTHGIMVSRCRCPSKDVIIVACPDTCLRKGEYIGKHRKTA